MATHFGGSLAGRKVAVWGLAFKPQTDDIRESPALTLLDETRRQGEGPRPRSQAMPSVKALYAATGSPSANRCTPPPRGPGRRSW